MKTTLARIAAAALPGFFAVLVIFAATAEADGGKDVNPTAMGQSLRAQLAGVDYQFAIATNGHLALTGEEGYASPSEALQELQLGQPGGDDTKCHLSDNGVEAVVILTNPPSALPQPCGVLGEAMEALA
jgi:hypothetical protein